MKRSKESAQIEELCNFSEALCSSYSEKQDFGDQMYMLGVKHALFWVQRGSSYDRDFVLKKIKELEETRDAKVDL